MHSLTNLATHSSVDSVQSLSTPPHLCSQPFATQSQKGREKLSKMQAVQWGLQARLCMPQASQLTQCSAARDGAGVIDAHCGWSHIGPASSQFFRGARMGADRDSEPPLSAGYFSYSSREARVVCMARERRVKMVSQQIKREISAMLLYDKVVQGAVLPETALGADMYLTAVATISEVEMSKDLSVAKVYISIYGDERGQNKALEGLRNKSGYVRKMLAQRMNLKNTPEVRFVKDEALERGSRVIGILDKLKREREAKEGKGPGNVDDDDGDQGDNHESDEQDVGNEARTPLSSSADDGDESDWDDDENITFIK